MSENDKEAVEEKVETTTDQQAATGETNEAVENKDAEETAAAEAAKQETNESAIDYEAELKRVEDERNNWKQAALDAKDKLKRKGVVTESVEETSSEDQNAVELIRQAVREEVAPLRSEILSDTVSNFVATLSDNQAEQRLIKFHYENTINKTGASKEAIFRDLQNAQAIANSKRLQKERDEAMLAIKNRGGMRNTSMGNNQSRTESEFDISKLKFNTAEMEVITRGAERGKISVAEYIKKNLATLR